MCGKVGQLSLSKCNEIKAPQSKPGWGPQRFTLLLLGLAAGSIQCNPRETWLTQPPSSYSFRVTYILESSCPVIMQVHLLTTEERSSEIKFCYRANIFPCLIFPSCCKRIVVLSAGLQFCWAPCIWTWMPDAPEQNQFVSIWLPCLRPHLALAKAESPQRCDLDASSAEPQSPGAMGLGHNQRCHFSASEDHWAGVGARERGRERTTEQIPNLL